VISEVCDEGAACPRPRDQGAAGQRRDEGAARPRPRDEGIVVAVAHPSLADVREAQGRTAPRGAVCKIVD
jgi:hypothetical protein